MSSLLFQLSQSWWSLLAKRYGISKIFLCTCEPIFDISWLSCHSHLNSCLFPIPCIELGSGISHMHNTALWSWYTHDGGRSNLFSNGILGRKSLLKATLYSLLVCLISQLILPHRFTPTILNQLSSCSCSHWWLTSLWFIIFDYYFQRCKVFPHEYFAIFLDDSYFTLLWLLDYHWFIISFGILFDWKLWSLLL